MEYNGKWLKDILNANGFTAEDLAGQTGLSEHQIEKVLADEPADRETWNTILTEINNYPTIDYPADSILQDLSGFIEEEGPSAECIVYYGVNSGDLIFADFTMPGDREEHGANVNLSMLSTLKITLQEAYELFKKQSLTLNS